MRYKVPVDAEFQLDGKGATEKRDLLTADIITTFTYTGVGVITGSRDEGNWLCLTFDNDAELSDEASFVVTHTFSLTRTVSRLTTQTVSPMTTVTAVPTSSLLSSVPATKICSW